MPRTFVKNKMRKNFRYGIKSLLESSKYVDAGDLEVIAALKDIPQGKESYESAPRKFGCIPWNLQLNRIVEQPNIDPNKPNTFIKVTVKCAYKSEERVPWTAKASGVLVMETWPEKVKGLSGEEKESKHREQFTQKFNSEKRSHQFLTKFPIPTRSRTLGASVADSPYLKNGQFKFRLELVIHNVRKVHFPIYDFQKKTPMCNATVKIETRNGNVYRYHVNKEYLSMHSTVLERMFNNPHFIEGQTDEVELKHTEPQIFNEFLSMVYPSRHRPHVKYLRGLLDFARCYFIPMVTAICEQRLLTTEDAEMAVGERLKLADEFALFQVKSNIMQKLDYEKVDDKSLDGLTPETLQMLLRKQKMQQAMAAAKREKQQKLKDKGGDGGGDEAMDVDQAAASSSSNNNNNRVQVARRGGAVGAGRGGHGIQVARRGGAYRHRHH